MKRLTQTQAKRLINLLAYGPLDRKEPVDTELIDMGWAQLYDDTAAVEGVDDASARLYDDRGCIKPSLMPTEWQPAPRTCYAIEWSSATAKGNWRALYPSDWTRDQVRKHWERDHPGCNIDTITPEGD